MDPDADRVSFHVALSDHEHGVDFHLLSALDFAVDLRKDKPTRSRKKTRKRRLAWLGVVWHQAPRGFAPWRLSKTLVHGFELAYPEITASKRYIFVK